MRLPSLGPRTRIFRPALAPKRPGWTLGSLERRGARPLARAKIGKAKLKLAIDLTREVLGVPANYRIGITPGSDTGAVEMALWSHARRARRRRAGLGKLRRRLGHRHRQAAQAQGRPHAEGDLRRAARSHSGQFRQRRRLHLERHDIRRARSGRRLDSRRPQGTDDLRRDVGRLRAGSRLGEARRRHLLLAEGAGRRGRARHDHSEPARGRKARNPTRPRGRCRSCSA